MGRKNKNKGQKQGEKKPQGDYRKNYKLESEITKENKTFEDFYRTNKIMPEEEIPEFIAAMKRPLPQTFRFAGFKNSAKLLINRMENNFLNDFTDLEIDGEKISKPAAIPWYPNGLAWTTTLSRQQLKRHAKLGEMHRFLIAESEAGYVTRQEAVSMIPPLFMDIKSDHAVLDLCAAPGSKTSQIIELMHEDFENNFDPAVNVGEKSVPQGFCIANDKNNKRCYMLVHQAKRLNSPSCIITNHDAAHFPGLVMKNENNEHIPLEFDRVLADVPCTGDGTMRKNFDIWKSWTSENSASLHPTQVKILKRALEMLKVGGKVIYSTCSLSPLEDEAVVGHVLSLCEGNARLVDCSDKLPGLKRWKGINTWKVLLKDDVYYDKFEDITSGKTHITRSMFPVENPEALNLDRCMRFLPHDQDTGGFFVCCIEKTGKLPWESDRKKSVQIANKHEDEPPSKKIKVVEKYRHGAYNEDPFYFYDGVESEAIKEAMEFYALDPATFPRNLIMSRSDPKVTSHPKHLYLVSPMVKHVLKYNFNRLHLINSGVRIFCRTNIPNTYHPYRCTNDGLDVLYRFVKNEKNGRCLPMSQADMITLLQSEYPKFADYSDELKQLHAQMDGKIGCIIAYLKEPIQIGEDKNFTCPLQLTAWRGQTKDKESLRAYIDKFDRRHYLHLLNAEVPESIDLNKSKHRKEYENGQVAEANVESASTLEEKAEPETETPVDPTPVEA